MMGPKIAHGGVDAEKPIISNVIFFCNIPVSTIPNGVVAFIHINSATLHDLVLGAELLVERSSSKPSRLQCTGSLRTSPVRLPSDPKKTPDTSSQTSCNLASMSSQSPSHVHFLHLPCCCTRSSITSSRRYQHLPLSVSLSMRGLF